MAGLFRRQTGFIAVFMMALILVGQLGRADEEDDPNCIKVDTLKSYITRSDRAVLLRLERGSVMMRLSRGCQNLHFHGYMSFIPVNGRLCIHQSEIKSRTGHSCEILSFRPIKKQSPD